MRFGLLLTLSVAAIVVISDQTVKGIVNHWLGWGSSSHTYWLVGTGSVSNTSGTTAPRLDCFAVEAQ